ncbi:hypothetical protein EsH8_X_000367 [Colletotrichum jinshuiense]
MAFRQTAEATIKSFLESYTDGASQNDPSIINRDVTPDCTRHLLPGSMLKAFGMPPDFGISTDAYEKNFAKDIRAFSVHDNVISNLVIDAETRKAAFTSVSKIVFKDGSESLALEFSWFLDFNEDGSKVKKVIEFCDKDSVVIVHAKVEAALAKSGDASS